ncbi:MAG TPA: hypothetical protein VL125_05575 [Pelobium sp.]|nr:hypothetical protein [Pelobium sp.]
MFYSVYPAKALPLNALKFALGICGCDEEIKALPIIANGAGESFLFTFLRKKLRSTLEYH